MTRMAFGGVAARAAPAGTACRKLEKAAEGAENV